MKSKLFASLALVAFLCVGIAYAEDKAATDVASLKCPVSNQACSADTATDYKGGKVYFCCEKCAKAFAANNAKFAAKANEQLVVSGQFEQVKCPVSGQAAKADKSVTVDGVDVHFCCGNCLAKVKDAEADSQAELVFGDTPFEKAFAKKQ